MSRMFINSAGSTYWTFSANHHNRRALLICQPVELTKLDPSSYGNSPSLVAPRPSIFGCESYTFKAVGVEYQCSVASRATKKVVAGIADDKAKVVLSREVDA